jgi:hypothetical protein
MERSVDGEEIRAKGLLSAVKHLHKQYKNSSLMYESFVRIRPARSVA